MRYKSGHKEESRLKLVVAAGRQFRASGYGGIGVDGLAREASVTSGAFYGHFSSKTEVFREAVVEGLRELKDGILQCQSENGAGWVAAFANYYLGPKRTCAMSVCCALPSLSAEVERAEECVRSAYEVELQEIVTAIAQGFPEAAPAQAVEKAWSLLALLAGGVLMSRAVKNEVVSADIARHVVNEAVRLFG